MKIARREENLWGKIMVYYRFEIDLRSLEIGNCWVREVLYAFG